MGLTIDDKAIRLAERFEKAGRAVERIIINGKEIQLVFVTKKADLNDVNLMDMKP